MSTSRAKLITEARWAAGDVVHFNTRDQKIQVLHLVSLLSSRRQLRRHTQLLTHYQVEDAIKQRERERANDRRRSAAANCTWPISTPLPRRPRQTKSM